MTTHLKITCKNKKIIIVNQNNKCANSPDNPVTNLTDYKCPFWIYNYGFVDDSGFNIDHIEEQTLTYNNNLDNLQALCKCCYSVKTKKNIKTYKMNTTPYDLHIGVLPMEID